MYAPLQTKIEVDVTQTNDTELGQLECIFAVVRGAQCIFVRVSSMFYRLLHVYRSNELLLPTCISHQQK